MFYLWEANPELSWTRNFRGFALGTMMPVSVLILCQRTLLQNSNGNKELMACQILLLILKIVLLIYIFLQFFNVMLSTNR